MPNHLVGFLLRGSWVTDKHLLGVFAGEKVGGELKVALQACSLRLFSAVVQVLGGGQASRV